MRFNDLNSWLCWLESQKIVRNAHVAKKQLAKIAMRLNLLSFAKNVITVAGTNGKGSCVALLESIYSEAGYNVGSFTSPHLLHFNERIRVQKKPVEDAKIIASFALIDEAREDIPLNYFQFSFLASLLIFKDANLDLIILEVGIGGKYDATNIIDADLAIISSVDLDHCEILGNTRELIGADKAGIMRKNRPVVCGDFNPPQSIYTEANRIGAKLYCQTQDFSFNVAKNQWDWFDKQNKKQCLPIPQNILLQNAATVLMALDLFSAKMPVTNAAIINGLNKVCIRGRQQLITINGAKVLLDVMHNPSAAKYLAEKLRVLKVKGRKFAIVGMMKEKNIADTLVHFIDYIDEWFVVELPSPRSSKSEHIVAELIAKGVKNIQSQTNSALAFQEALQKAKVDDIIIAFGSFLLVSDVLREVVKHQRAVV